MGVSVHAGWGGVGSNWYNTNKALLDAVSQVVVGMSHSEFVKEAVKRLPQAQDEFGELYATQRLEMKVGRAVMRSYKAAPRKGRSVFKFYLCINKNSVASLKYNPDWYYEWA